MMHGLFDMPTFAYFDFGNIWTGSLYREFNYKVYPLKKAEPPELKTVIWFGKKSIDNITEEEYHKVLHHEFSDEGYQKLLAELNDEANEYAKTHKTVFY